MLVIYSDCEMRCEGAKNLASNLAFTYIVDGGFCSKRDSPPIVLIKHDIRDGQARGHNEGDWECPI